MNFSGTPGRLTSPTRCVIGPLYKFNPNQTGNVINGNTITIGGPTLVAADNARFAVQVLNKAGVQQSISFETF